MGKTVLGLLLGFCPAAASSFEILEDGRAIGVIEWFVQTATSPAEGPNPTLKRGEPSGRAAAACPTPNTLVRAHSTAIARAILRARKALVALGWPLEDQAERFRVVVEELGPERLGVADRGNRMRVTVPANLGESDEEVAEQLSGVVAHEYLHLCQYRAINRGENQREERFLWWMEATAIFFEHHLAPIDQATGQKVRTYEDSISLARGDHARAGLGSRKGGSTLGYCYAPLAFILAREMGSGFIAKTWLECASPRGTPPRTAVEAIERTLLKDGIGHQRARFPRVFERYVLYMLSKSSRWLREGLGLEVLSGAPLRLTDTAVSSQAHDLELPGLSFRIYSLNFDRRGSRACNVSVEGRPGLLAFVADADDSGAPARRVRGDFRLDHRGPGSKRLVLINPTAKTLPATVTMKSVATNRSAIAKPSRDTGD